jgi:KUP system potassium uptake protein
MRRVPTTTKRDASAQNLVRAGLIVAALGVVFGDIGTSPLYAVQAAFDPEDPHPVHANLDSVYGLISLIFWAVTIIVTFKYVVLVMRADNQGEGGIMALIGLVQRTAATHGKRTQIALAGLGVFGAALFFGDSMITPAISVLSAVEGMEVVEPTLKDWIVPATVAIILVLFSVQRFGTGAIGRFFGPVMLVWFATLAVLGIHGISKHPEVLEALSPTYAFEFLFEHGSTGFFALTAVVLAFTGVEALYADMGHFGRRPITVAWLFLVFPALILNYLGQGALIVDEPSKATGNPFYLLVPDAVQVPMIFLATGATVIASQAVIAGAYSIARQSVQLGYLPRVRILHTSAREEGQVYVPVINWVLLIGVLALVLSFRSSTKLAFAYGTAVSGTIAITTILYFWIVHHRWKKPLWLALLGGGAFLIIDLSFFAANLTKLFHGAWLPLLIGAIAFTVLMTWHRGRQLVTREREREEGPLREFVDDLHELGSDKLVRVPGTAVFLNRDKTTAPLAMRATVEHNRALHKHVVILSIETLPLPHLPDSKRLKVDDLGYSDDGITHVEARFGFMDEPDVPRVLRLIEEHGVETSIDVNDARYFLSKVDFKPGHAEGMSRWRKRLFLATSRLSSDAADYFHLPRDRTVIMGSRIEF